MSNSIPKDAAARALCAAAERFVDLCRESEGYDLIAYCQRTLNAELALVAAVNNYRSADLQLVGNETAQKVVRAAQSYPAVAALAFARGRA